MECTALAQLHSLRTRLALLKQLGKKKFRYHFHACWGTEPYVLHYVIPMHVPCVLVNNQFSSLPSITSLLLVEQLCSTLGVEYAEAPLCARAS